MKNLTTPELIPVCDRCKHSLVDDPDTAARYIMGGCINCMEEALALLEAEGLPKSRNMLRHGLELAAYALALRKTPETLNAMLAMSDAYLAQINDRATVGTDCALPSVDDRIEGALVEVNRVLKVLADSRKAMERDSCFACTVEGDCSQHG